MAKRRKRSWDEIKVDLSRLRIRRQRQKAALEETFDELNGCYREAADAGVKVSEIARASDSNPQHIRNVLANASSYAAKNKKDA